MSSFPIPPSVPGVRGRRLAGAVVAATAAAVAATGCGIPPDDHAILAAPSSVPFDLLGQTPSATATAGPDVGAEATSAGAGAGDHPRLPGVEVSMSFTTRRPFLPSAT